MRILSEVYQRPFWDSAEKFAANFYRTCVVSLLRHFYRSCMKLLKKLRLTLRNLLENLAIIVKEKRVVPFK